jgi:deoxycytidine triphosphate deaminase
MSSLFKTLLGLSTRLAKWLEGSMAKTPKRLSRPASHDEAERRAADWERLDPFTDLSPALLTAAQVSNYCRVTGLIYPFEERLLKGATYEIGISGYAYYWDENGKRRVVSVKDEGFRGITLRPNSITFVETDVVFRLPQYIAGRFNLHIKLVHRGLLLGTGPIVDPGFRGRLLIPLHNLTSSPYTIADGEKIVWMEFTKTTYGESSKEAEYECFPPDYRDFPHAKRHLTSEQYLWKANANNPILSSISGFVAEVKGRVSSNEAKVDRIEAIGLLALIVTVGLGILTSWSIYHNALGLVQGYQSDRAALEKRVKTLECKIARRADCSG